MTNGEIIRTAAGIIRTRGIRNQAFDGRWGVCTIGALHTAMNGINMGESNMPSVAHLCSVIIRALNLPNSVAAWNDGCMTEPKDYGHFMTPQERNAKADALEFAALWIEEQERYDREQASAQAHGEALPAVPEAPSLVQAKG